MRSRAVALILTAVALAASAHAQSIGNYILNPNSGVADIQRPFTVIDLNSPATTSGTIGVVAVRAVQTCTNAFKIKFFHQANGVYTPFAERGPFDVTRSLMLATISPPVTVAPGDLIGLVALQDCTRFIGQVGLLFENGAQFNGDVSGPVSLTSAVSILPNFALAAYGAPSPNAEIRTQVIIGAGATQGAAGSSFKTDLFITNIRTSRSAGRLVYHPQNTIGTPLNEAFPFIVDPHASVTYPNFVQNRIGVTGIGSIDVYTTIGYEPPVISTRIYDEGAGQTKGFTLDALPLSEALQTFDHAVLFVPPDPSKFRMNIGVRTLDEETQIEYDVYDSAGGVRGFFNKVYPPNTFLLTDFQSLFGIQFQAGDTIFVFPRRGSAYVFGSIIDNASNDPSTQVAKPLE